MFSIAHLFTATRLLESELRRERVLRRKDQLQAERERRALTDALARASHREAVYHRPETTPSPDTSMAFGPSAIRARRELQEQEQEIFTRAEAARNGNGPVIPEIPAN